MNIDDEGLTGRLALFFAVIRGRKRAMHKQKKIFSFLNNLVESEDALYYTFIRGF
jgi:hypothetical protein